MPTMPHINLRADFSKAGLARLCRLLGSVVLAGLLSACAGWPDANAPASARALTPWDTASVRVDAGSGPAVSPASQWQHHTFPGKSANQFAYLQLDGRRAMGVRSKGAASMLRKTVSIDPAQLASLRSSWKVPSLI